MHSELGNILCGWACGSEYSGNCSVNCVSSFGIVSCLVTVSRRICKIIGILFFLCLLYYLSIMYFQVYFHKNAQFIESNFYFRAYLPCLELHQLR